MPRLLRIPSLNRTAFALFTLTTLIWAQIASAQNGSRILSGLDEADVVTLAGNVHPLARAEFDRGSIKPETRLERMVLVLRPSSAQQRELDRLTEAQQEQSSPEYRQWLTPAEFGARFGVSPRDLARTAAWLRSHGFQVEPVSAGRGTIVFSGTAAQVAEAFHTEMHHYVVEGVSHVANSQDPQIPRALASVVAGVLSLHDFRRQSATRSVRSVPSWSGTGKTHPDNTQGNTHYLFPADFATIYDLKPQYTAGNTGAGTTIAIVGRSNINLSDVSSFRSYAGLPVNQPAVILDGANPGLISGDQDEATLDVEWSGAVAPGAAVKFVVAGSTVTTDGVDLSASYIVNNKTATVMSTSFGSCEADMGSGEMAFYNSLWQQAAAEGISAFVSSGDSGAAGCQGGGSSSGSGQAVNGLCSSPYSTCVGGTEFDEGSATYWSATNGVGGGSAVSYIPEKVWNESGNAGGSGLWSSGGGISGTYPQPSWQAGVSGASSNGMRAVPDVALTAASHDGYLVCENGSWYVFAGTSAASPSFAGIMSLVVEKQAGKAQGNANPTLYGLLTASANPFHATPTGNNSVPGVTGFTASGAAYNLATGLGSVDGNLLVNEWPSASGGTTPAGFSLSASVSSEALAAGKSASFTVSVAGTGGFAGAVVLSATAPSGVTVSFVPASLRAGGSATATVSVAPGTAAESGTITLTGTSGSVTHTAVVGMTVTSAPSLSVSAASGSVAVAQGQSATLSMTVTTGGAFSGVVALTVTGLPSGVTAAWSPSAFSMSGVGSTTSTLTLTASNTATLTTASLSIKAAGAGLQAQTTASVQVTAAAGIKLTLPAVQVAMQSNATQQLVVTVTSQGGVAPAANLSGVNFQATGMPTGVTASWSAPVLSGPGTIQATLSLAGSSSAVSSKATIWIMASVTDATTGNAYSASQQLSLTVTLARSLRLSLAAGPINVVTGKYATEAITISSNNSFFTPVTLAVSGLPAGVTASWSANPVTPGANGGLASSTLTLWAAISATPASGTITVTATGGGVTATGSFSVQVRANAFKGRIPRGHLFVSSTKAGLRMHN
jgi:hypothetical protein